MQNFLGNEEVFGAEIENPQINVDLLNLQHLINPESEVGQNFNELMQGLKKRLLSGSPQQKNILDKLKINFYIQDNADNSFARVSGADFKMSANDFTGDEFAIFFNRKKLSEIKYSDQLAYVLGHELSHLIYCKSSNDEMKYQHNNEEVSCDLNSLQLMKEAGFSMRAGLSVNDIYVNKAPEMNMRVKHCSDFVRNNPQFGMPVDFEHQKFTEAKYTKVGIKFDFPETHNESEQIAAMLGNLDKVFRHGDRDAFRIKFGEYLQTLGSEKASKLVINLAAEAVDRFSPIDEVKMNSDYRKYLNHPFNVMTDIVKNVGNMKGKKFYPPKSLAKVNSYLDNNQNFYNGMASAWNSLFKADNFFDISGKER